MRVRIVCYEDVDTWILGKFARKLNDELKKQNIESDIAKVADPKADINHHIIYVDFNGKRSSIDTLLITHIDSLQKLNQLKRQLGTARAGVCFSSETMLKLVAAGIPQEKLFFINPAHDGVIRPRPIAIGITSKVHIDGRKNEKMFIDLCQKISPKDFMFKIMGAGWEELVNEARKSGFTIEYDASFDYDKYVKLIPTLDYFLYFGFDEGSMGFADALSAGVKTMVTPQGFHLDIPHGISYPIKTFDDIVLAFNKISDERKKLIHSVSAWTWENYANKHIALWQCLMHNQSFLPLLKEGASGMPRSHVGNIKQTVSLSRINAVRASLGYIFLPLTFKTLLWSILPSFFKKNIKKYLEKKSL